MDFEFVHPHSGEKKSLTLSDEEVRAMLPQDFVYDKLVEQECNCQAIGETNYVDCVCDEYLSEFDMQA